MTSRIYGIAVKEIVDYYEYDDIKLVFNQDTKQWSVFSNFDNLWMNGVQYHKGDLVVMFADGKVDTYTMMAQYTDTSPYINYMYTITSNFVINPSYYQNGRIEYIFEADPETEPYQFTCKKLLNNVQQNSYTLTDVDIKTYKNQNHGKLPTLFDNMKVDYHGMNPESPYLPYSFTIISNSNYIKDGTTPKQINDIIIQIPAGSGASSYFHRILDETNKHEATPKPGELPSILMTKKIGKYNAKPSVTFNRETIIRKIYHDHTKVYYNGHYHRAMYLVYDSTGAQGCWKKTIEGLAFTYADPFWLCMTTSAGIELGGQVLEAKRLVRCWKDTDDINLTMRKTKSRKKAAPETAPYDDIIYDVVSNASNVTVTKYRRKTKIDAQGHKTTEDIQEDLPIVFDTGDSPVRCWNIEFRAKNNVWTIYSKCGYIRYGGRQYPKNRSILDFNAGEEMHIEIKDETEKYEVDEVITYTVTNVMVTKFIYKVWTVGESYTIKVEKSAENVDPEPWVTVNFYDAWNEHPVVIDDIQLDYDIKTNIWTLSSASDELYYYGRKINKGEKIAEWGFNTIISLKDERGINVISANAEKDVKVHIDSTKSQPQGLDISEFYPSNDYYNVDFLLTHSVTKGEWVITSKRDDTYMNGVRYTYNKVIFQGSDKQGYPDFTFMCQHKKDESGPIIPTKNIMYTITISWDPYEQIGNLSVQAAGGESKVYYTRKKDPAKNTIVLTKQNAKSMYGYIWKRDMPGPGPEWSLYDMLVPAAGRDRYGYYEKLIGVKPGTRIRLIHAYSRRNYSNIYSIIDRISSNFYYRGYDALSYASNYGESFYVVSGLDSGAYAIGCEGINTIVCVKYIDQNNKVFQKYRVFGSSASKFKDNMCQNNANDSFGYIYEDNMAINLSSTPSTIWLFNLESNTIFRPLETINEENSARHSEWNYTHVEPDTGYIESRRVVSFNVTSNSKVCIIGGKSVYFIDGPITCQVSGGYAHIPGSGFTYLAFNWGICAYRLNKNGLSPIITDIMSNEIYNTIPNYTSISCKYNNKYYGSGIIWQNETIAIYCYDEGKIILSKSINRNSKIRIKVYASADCQEYEYYDLYFDNRAYSYNDKVIGCNGLYSYYKIDSKRFYVQMNTTIRISSTEQRDICILIDNPFLEESIGNFAFFESLV